MSSESHNVRIVVLGVGNRYRRDDGVGVFTAHLIRETALPSVDVEERSGEGLSLMESWRGYDVVYLIDAAQSDTAPGTVHRFNAQAQSIPTEFFHYSSHAFGVAQAVELARILGRLPASLTIYGIDGRDFGAGEGLTAKVEEAARRTATEITESIGRLNADSHRGPPASSGMRPASR